MESRGSELNVGTPVFAVLMTLVVISLRLGPSPSQGTDPNAALSIDISTCSLCSSWSLPHLPFVITGLHSLLYLIVRDEESVGTDITCSIVLSSSTMERLVFWHERRSVDTGEGIVHRPFNGVRASSGHMP